MTDDPQLTKLIGDLEDSPPAINREDIPPKITSELSFDQIVVVIENKEISNDKTVDDIDNILPCSLRTQMLGY